MLNIKSKGFIAATTLMVATLATSANAQTSPGLLSQIYNLVAPGVVGNVAQVAVGATRVGSTGGVSGNQGTPTTVAAVNVAHSGEKACGSEATVNVLDEGGLLSFGC